MVGGDVMTQKFYTFLAWLVFIIIPVVLLVGVITITIVAFVMYGDKPITEVPMWAMYFLRR